MRYSIIIPVYNRPDEVDELLAGLIGQGDGFEVIIVEDGSSHRCDDVVAKYAGELDVKYFFKPNSGPGTTRNYGAERSQGQYLLFLDSDCVTPRGWLDEIGAELASCPADAFGGPDRAHEGFTALQKAINYSMTSPLTTGGIRGGAATERLRECRDRVAGGAGLSGGGKGSISHHGVRTRTGVPAICPPRARGFVPRSFNMGVRREVFEAVGGFGTMRFGEDIDLGYRIAAAGYTSRLFPRAWVWHKRRTNLRRFFKQVFNSGIARVALSVGHKGTLKAVHVLPAAFTVGCAAIVAAAPWWPWALLAFALFAVVIFTDAAARTREPKVAALAVCASFVQLVGYGGGFVYGLLGRGRTTAFERTFYK